MLGLVLIHLLIWATLVALLWGGGMILQGLIYNEPASQFYWRAPTVAAMLTLWIAFWSNREYRSYQQDGEPARYGAMYQFAASDRRTFNEFWVVGGDRKVRYTKRLLAQSNNRPARPRFVAETPPHQAWTRSETIVLKEDNADVTYRLQRDRNGKTVESHNQGAVYRSEAGAILNEDSVRYGRIETFRWGLFLTYALLNIGFLTLWFAGLWAVLRFQWMHALGLASVLWVVAIVFVIPPLVERVDRLGTISLPVAAGR